MQPAAADGNALSPGSRAAASGLPCAPHALGHSIDAHDGVALVGLGSNGEPRTGERERSNDSTEAHLAEEGTTSAEDIEDGARMVPAHRAHPQSPHVVVLQTVDGDVRLEVGIASRPRDGRCRARTRRTVLRRDTRRPPGFGIR